MKAKNPRYNTSTGRIDATLNGIKMSFAASHDVVELQTPEGRAQIRKAMIARAKDSGGFLRYDEENSRLVYASDGQAVSDE